MKLRARWETPVDLDSLTAIDGAALTPYADANDVIKIPPGGILLANHALVALEGDTYNIPGTPHLGGGFGGAATLSIRPWYDRVQEQSLLGQLSNPTTEWVFGNVDTDPMSPQALIDNETGCFHNLVNYTVRLKGSVTLKKLGGSSVNRTVGLAIYNRLWGPTRVLLDSVVIAPLGASPAGNETFNFDQTFTGSFLPIPIPLLTLPSNPFYAVVEVGVTWGSINMDFSWHFDPETEVNVNVVESCPATDAKVYYLHENMSRVVESVTNNCMKMRSDYYGRTDAEPYFGADGCGGLRAITNGQFLRQATEAAMKISAKQIFEGLLNIDCIGMGIEMEGTDQILRVEDFEYFYRNVELLVLDHVSGLVKEVIEDKYYNEIFVGYKKWDTTTISCAQQEYNSERLYITKFNQTKQRIEVASELITGMYMIERARKAALATAEEKGSTENDADIFLFCLQHGIIDYEVEQGNITTATNIADPARAINYRLTPARNALRWWRILAAGFRDILDLDAELRFKDGKGNVKASAILTNGCIPELSTLAEDADINDGSMISSYRFPLWTPEKIIFDYPLSIQDYIKLKANPNGYISYQCGNGTIEQGWITEMKYSIADGKATFTLLAKR
jgi:hypothetical protein